MSCLTGRRARIEAHLWPPVDPDATGAILGLSASGLYDMTSPKVVEAKRAEIYLKDGF